MTKSVLVVGAGPVGLTMAAELARYRVPVRIIDQAPAPTDKSKALGVWSRTLELLDRAGGARAFVSAGLKSSAATIRSGRERIAHISFDSVPSPFQFLLMLPQSETERLMGEHLQSLGITVERSVELTGFDDLGDGVSCAFRHADGREETIEASWLIGCDGAHSLVRHKLGMAFEGDTLATNFILADVHVSGFDEAPDELVIVWHEDGAVVFFPISAGRYRVVADVGENRGRNQASKRFRRLSPSAALRASLFPTPSGSPLSASINARSRIIAPAACSSPAMRRMSTARPAAKA